MDMPDHGLAAHEIDRRLRNAAHHRRIRLGRAGRSTTVCGTRLDCGERAWTFG